MPNFCSWCLSETSPKLVREGWFTRNDYQCGNLHCCRSIVSCRVPGCLNYARWDSFAITVEGKDVGVYEHDQFCGEHGGDVPNFATLNSTLTDPSDWRKVYDHRCTNIAKIGHISLVALGGMAVAGPLAFVAGPAIGGALGTLLGLKGAAATGAGLAFLGGGSLAAGGLGMAGGLAVLTVLGTGVGGAAGAYLGNAYLGDVKGFNVRRLRTGRFPAIVTVNGFLTEGDDNLADWQAVLDRRYPRHAWYHVDWEAKQLHELGSLAANAFHQAAFRQQVSKAAQSASKAAAKNFGPAATIVQCLSLANNPWHVAFVKAGMTGVLLADILRRCNDQSFILLGHSLGARVIYSALTTLSTTATPIVEKVHLMGGAVDNDPENWKQAIKAVRSTVHNYYSLNDSVLQYLFGAGTFFMSTPIGRNPILVPGMGPNFTLAPGVDNHDVTQSVAGHMNYKQAAPEFLCQEPVVRPYVLISCSSCATQSRVWVDQAQNNPSCGKCGKQLQVV